MIKRTELQDRWIPWLLGFALIANVYLIPTRAQTPRATDAIGALLFVWMVWHFFHSGVPRNFFIGAILFFSAPFLWTIFSGLQAKSETLVQGIRWIVAIPWGYTIWIYSRKPMLFQRFLEGMWWGVWMNVVVMSMQYMGQTELTQNLGLAARDFSYSLVRGRFRTPGMFGHPNEAGAITSLAIPISLYWFSRGNSSRIILISFAAISLAAHFGSTRSALVVSLVLFVLVSIKSITSKRMLLFISLIATIGIVLIVTVGPPGGWDRWLDIDHLELNVNERFTSNLGAINLIGHYPLGLGVEATKLFLANNTGISATHNAFLQSALVYGIWQGLLLILIIGTLSFRFLILQRRWRFDEILATQMLGLFFFEEHLNNPAFVIILSWLSIRFFRSLFNPILFVPKSNIDPKTENTRLLTEHNIDRQAGVSR